MIPKCTVNTNGLGTPRTPCGIRARFSLCEGHPSVNTASINICTEHFWMFLKTGAIMRYVRCLWKPAEWMKMFDGDSLGEVGPHNWGRLPFIELPEGWR